MWQGYQFVVTAWALTVFCLLLVCIRLYVQLKTRVRPWREILLVYAWFTLAANASTNTIFWKAGNFDSINLLKYDRTAGIGTNKADLADQFTWTLGCAACRILLLLMYRDLCPRHCFPKTWWLIVLTFVLVVAGVIALNFVYVFMICWPEPISAYWTVGTDCSKGTGFAGTYAAVGFTVIIIIDIPVYIIPIIIIFHLRNLTKTQQIGAAAMFAIGFINVAMMIMNLALVILIYYLPRILNEDIGGFLSFSEMLQLPTAIMIICIPQLRIVGRLWVTKAFGDTIRSVNREAPESLSASMIEVRDAGAGEDFEMELAPVKYSLQRGPFADSARAV